MCVHGPARERCVFPCVCVFLLVNVVFHVFVCSCRRVFSELAVSGDLEGVLRAVLNVSRIFVFLGVLRYFEMFLCKFLVVFVCFECVVFLSGFAL